MTYPIPSPEFILEKISRLQPESKAFWGDMSAQRMVEHLSEAVQISFQDHDFPLTVPEDKIERAQAFLASEHPMPKNFKVDFAKPETPLRLESIEKAVEELLASWEASEAWWNNNPDTKRMHPSFGNLDRSQWQRVHAKHFAHHFEQFGL